MKPINNKNLIAVEGKDEINFISAFFNHIKPEIDIELREVGGKDQFKNKIPALKKASGFCDVENFLIIRDADENQDDTFRSIVSILKNEDLSIPSKVNIFSTGSPRVCIFLMPGNTENGMLEDLCLKTVEKHPAMTCVNAFIECVTTLKDTPQIMAKAKVQAYLAAMPKIINSVGLAAKKGYWDFDSIELDELKSILLTL